MPQYYYTVVSDQQLQYNKIKYKRRKKRQSYFYHKTDVFHTIGFHRRFHNYFAHFMLAAGAFTVPSPFVQFNITQSTGRAMKTTSHRVIEWSK